MLNINQFVKDWINMELASYSYDQKNKYKKYLTPSLKEFQVATEIKLNFYF